MDPRTSLILLRYHDSGCSAERHSRRDGWPAISHRTEAENSRGQNGLVMGAIRDGVVLSPPLTATEAPIGEIVENAPRSIEETPAALGQS